MESLWARFHSEQFDYAFLILWLLAMTEDLQAELRADLAEQSPDWCATKWILEAVPYLFRSVKPADYWAWKSKLAERIGVDAKDVLVAGSGAVGFSLNPSKALKAFDSESDVDVAVISPYHFDLAWRTLRALGASRFKLNYRQRSAVDDHVARLIFWGTIATDRLLPIFPFGKQWLAALTDMGTIPPTVGREVNVRVYRDYASLRSYLLTSFKKTRELGAASELSEPIGDKS